MCFDENEGEKRVLMTWKFCWKGKMEIKRTMTIYPVDRLLSEPEFWEIISELRIPRIY